MMSMRAASRGGFIVRSVALARYALASVLAHAQFGHPLKGQWSGQWGPVDSPNRLLLTLEWDGKAITGVINPAPKPRR